MEPKVSLKLFFVEFLLVAYTWMLHCKKMSEKKCFPPFFHMLFQKMSLPHPQNFGLSPRTLGMRFREIKCRVGVGIFCNHIIYFRTMDIVQSKEPRKLLSSSPIRGWQWQWQWLYFPYWNNTASILCCYNLHLGGRLRKLSQTFTKCISVYNFSAQ